MKQINVTIEVYEFGQDYRKGNLFIDGRLVLRAIEPKDRELNSEMTIDEILAKKVQGFTAIPFGEYMVKYIWSDKFKKIVPGLCDVKGFGDIEIHAGNSSKDSEGCILVGVTDRMNENWIGFSITGTRILNDYLCNGNNGEIILTIKKK